MSMAAGVFAAGIGLDFDDDGLQFPAPQALAQQGVRRRLAVFAPQRKAQGFRGKKGWRFLGNRRIMSRHMNTILYVRREGFYVSALLARDPSLFGAPLIVHHQGSVLDMNDAASARGIRLGMAEREAKTILRGEGKMIALKPEDFRAEASAWLDLCAEASDTVEPGLPHEAWVDLSGHPRPSETAWELLRRVEALL